MTQTTEKTDVKNEFEALMASSKETMQETVNFLRHNGVELAFDKWVTIAKYAEIYDTSTQVVTNWISRGIVPAENIRVVEELNDLRLIKAVKYK